MNERAHSSEHGRRRVGGVVVRLATLLGLLIACEPRGAPSRESGRFQAGIGTVVDAKGAFHLERETRASERGVPPGCRVAERARLVTVDRPIDAGPGAPMSAGSFPYSVEYVASEAPGLPVVVRIPGGPGDSLFGDVPMLPAGWGYVNTEPRGVGCNRPLDIPNPDAFYGSAVFAADLAAVLQRLSLPNVVLHGQGYGSVVATLLAAKLDGGNTVSAVVFEGALAVPYPATSPPGAALARTWRATRARLSKPQRLLLEDDAPLGVAADDWGREFSVRVAQGTFYDPETRTVRTPLHEFLAEVDAAQKADGDLGRNPRFLSLRAKKPAWTQEKKALFREVACRELSPLSAFGPPRFEAGVFASPTSAEAFDPRDVACGGLRAKEGIAKPLSLVDVQWRAPSFWFLGDADVETPLWQGLLHASLAPAQVQGAVTVVHAAGAKALSRALADCAPVVWQALVSRHEVEGALKACRMKTSTRVRK